MEIFISKSKTRNKADRLFFLINSAPLNTVEMTAKRSIKSLLRCQTRRNLDFMVSSMNSLSLTMITFCYKNRSTIFWPTDKANNYCEY